MSAKSPSTAIDANRDADRINAMFARRKAEGGAAMIFFLTAGHPNEASTETAIEALEAGGADLIELGIPFSDPVADGPTIQKASQVALEAGMNVEKVMSLTARVRSRSQIPLILFTGYNPVYVFGEERFAERAAEAGADGILVPDLPPEEAGVLSAACEKHGLKLIFLVAPTTTPERARMIGDASSGFLYYISLRGVTGARAELPTDLKENIDALKARTSLPIAVGFGISEPAHAAAVAQTADGVVVGSALVRRIEEDASKPDFARSIEAFARGLSDAAHSGAPHQNRK